MHRTHIAAVVVLLTALAVPQRSAYAAPLVTEDLSGPLTPEDLAVTLAGPGVTVSNVVYRGTDVAAGRFSGGGDVVGFADGIALSSGDIANVVGPNDDEAVTGENLEPGDADLDVLSGFDTYDATVLEFDFVPDAARVSFRYVFASDEYSEYVHSEFNDVFGFFMNGTNCALVPGTGDPVTINTINDGNPWTGDEAADNPGFYRDNDRWRLEDDGEPLIDTEMDGLTVVLRCEADVVPDATNHLKLAIADASDEILDSAVFLQRGSLTTRDCGEDGLAILEGTPAGGVASGTIHGQAEPLIAGASPELAGQVHTLNCERVVPVEDAVDGLLG